jgi:rhomboid family GlyGly-CTERM serine protease
LWTGHLVHGSSYHLIWNLLPLIGLGFLFEKTLRQRLWTLFFLSAPLIGAGTLLLEPQLSEYRGLSGFLNTLFIAGALRSASEERIQGNRAMELVYIGCIVGDFAKIAFETWGGAPLFTAIDRLGGVPVPVAHLLGALVGLLGEYSFVQPRSVDFPDTMEKGRLPI